MLLRLCRGPASLRMVSALALQLVNGMPSAADTIQQSRACDRHHVTIHIYSNAAHELSGRLG
jgi:hypothetical protein